MARTPTDQQIRDWLAEFAGGGINVERAERLIDELRRAGPRVLEPLFAWLRGGSEVERQAAGALLVTLADDMTAARLSRLAGEPDLPDVARAHIAAILEELGETEAARAIWSQLPDPMEAATRLLEEILTASLTSPTGLQMVLEMIDTLPPEGSEQLVRSLGPGDPRAQTILLALLDGAEPTALAAARALADWQDAAVLPALAAAARRLPFPTVRQAAAEAQQQIEQRLGVETPASARPLWLWSGPENGAPVREVWASLLDGDGGQVVLVCRGPKRGPYLLSSVFHNERHGIQDADGSEALSREEYQGLVQAFAHEGIRLVRVDLAQARWLIEEAYALNLRNRRRLPLAFWAWRTLFRQPAETLAAEQPWVKETPALPDDWAARLLDAAKLLRRPEFDSWLFEPKYIGAELNELTATSQEGLTGRAYRQRLDHLVESAIQRAFTVPVRERLTRRLRLQARMLQMAGEGELAQLALIASTSLAKGSGVAPTRNPFLRRMMTQTLEEAALTLF